MIHTIKRAISAIVGIHESGSVSVKKTRETIAQLGRVFSLAQQMAEFELGLIETSQLRSVRDSHARTVEALSDLQQQLAAEREAHTATKLAWKEARELGETRENVEALRRELAAEREAHENLKTRDCRWSEYADEQQEQLRHLKEQLAAERDAHAEDRLALEMLDQSAQAMRQQLHETTDQLASALDKLDKLTRWRKQSEEKCPLPNEYVKYSRDGKESAGECFGASLTPVEFWRHTPESLQALKESEDGDG